MPSNEQENAAVNTQKTCAKPLFIDLTHPVKLETIPENQIVEACLGEQSAILIREGTTLSILSGKCTHAGGPLAEGLLMEGHIRCPWHHACFDAHTGEALAAPAFDPLERWAARIEDGMVFVDHKDSTPTHALQAAAPSDPFVIVGGGAAGFAAAEALYHEGFVGQVVLISREAAGPYDRTMLSKDYLGGKLGEDQLPLHSQAFGQGSGKSAGRIDLGTEVERIDRGRHCVVFADGQELRYAKLLLATGAEPRAPTFPGYNLPHVHVLRSLADCRSLIEHAAHARHVVVLGASFIGLEAAASLRERGLEVDIVAHSEQPMEKTLGAQLGETLRALHENHGNRFHLGRTILSVEPDRVLLDDGTVLPADLVLVGIGVEPRLDLAKASGLVVENGVLVDEFLATSDPDIYAAGDIAAWPDPHSGRRIRVEHWDVAERQGQIAAKNMLGLATPFTDVPFFWTRQFDFSLSYIGHAPHWDRIEIDGDPSAGDGTLRYIDHGQVIAAAMIGRDAECLRERERMEHILAA
ncbi:FAD-dependent oxidoreductase [Beijerinckia indica]|uniref:FAD-dependent pyridine nucleotide-disulphide oxidoreductase n=1 Tax=Beijerinckia indica subsp. indica (strain ATCC 9039 / DSM 1715 / NCIMB 8712) TaxID=395963 RepID=B2IEU5_BEII9|nr:FAD-dependent oxidoreductase [Beijerinckia indica]ACB94218.1 FAD-dependent pyridine nucleotide-disulphide oxidoreductase [Beijerinckia indica subsp. indica ATCC 9039]